MMPKCIGLLVAFSNCYRSTTAGRYSLRLIRCGYHPPGPSAGRWEDVNSKPVPSIDHPGTDRAVCRLVDEDEAAGGAVAAVLVAQQRRRCAEPDPADLVEAK